MLVNSVALIVIVFLVMVLSYIVGSLVTTTYWQAKLIKGRDLLNKQVVRNSYMRADNLLKEEEKLMVMYKAIAGIKDFDKEKLKGKNDN